MKIIHLSAECFPAAKVGGLADVVGALPKYLNQAGLECIVLIPAYTSGYILKQNWEVVHSGILNLGNQNLYFTISRNTDTTLGYDLYIAKVDDLFAGAAVYAGQDDTERFIAFQIAALEWINSWENLPEIVHCHDHHTGLVPFIMQHSLRYSRLKTLPTLFTMHSGQYQGQFSWDKSYLIPSFDDYRWGLLDWDNKINPMAAAIKCCSIFTTVSQGYLVELQQNAMGLESLIREEESKSYGIVNGIDSDVWNPSTDKYLTHFFTLETVNEGKKENKRELCRLFGLSEKLPLVVFIGRLVAEKGADFLAEIIYKSIQEYQTPVNFLVLGSGENYIEDYLTELKNPLQGRFNCYIGYNEKLSHLMYAGADFLLMPSRVEPCGLNQLYAMRYGTIPIVRSTGGLIDTVIDLNDSNGFGIRFENADSVAASYAVARAAELANSENKLMNIRKKIMAIDHSWKNKAEKYINLYKKLKP